MNSSRSRHLQLSRRSLLASSVWLAAGATAGPTTAAANRIPIDVYDPYGPLDQHLDALFRLVLLNEGGAGAATRRLWAHYEKSGTAKYAEWALIYGFVWWRDSLPGKARLRVAMLGERMALMVQRQHPQELFARAWASTYEGFIALSRGVMNSLQSAPTILDKAERIISADPAYFYGIGLMTASRVFFKAPVFPVSRGDIKKSLTYLERARPYTEGKFGQWYFFYAEALHIAKQPAAAKAIADSWEQEITPVNRIELLGFGMSRIDFANFYAAIADEAYDRYLWDAMLQPISRPQLQQQYDFLKSRFIN